MSISRPPKFFSCISHAISVSYVPPHLVHSNLTLSSAGRCFHFWCCTSPAFDLHTLPHPSYLHTKSITLLSFLSHILSFAPHSCKWPCWRSHLSTPPPQHTTTTPQPH